MRSDPSQPPTESTPDTFVLPSARPEEHTRIGPYQLLQRLGEGGMGEVWLADQLEPVRRRVAFKVIKAGMDTKEVVARFESERQALALMDHPAIARVYDGGSTPHGRPYFVMEYVPGIPITEHCDRHALSTHERLELFCRVCDGVQHAHQKAVIHRDLKPSNILVSLADGQGQPKIIDFGIAKATAQRLTEKTLHTQLGSVIGTPEYMSPEQADLTGQDVDTRTDVYSLGVLLYQLLTGELPFSSVELRSSTPEDMRRKLREVEPPRPSTRVETLGDRATDAARRRQVEPGTLTRQLRGDLDAITMKALEKERARRYGSPSDLAADIARHLHHEPVLARRPSQRYRVWKYVRRHRVGVTAASALLGLILAFAGAMAVQAGRIGRERDRANREAAASKRVASFMMGMFKVSDPGEARGNSITAREILDRASNEIEVGLKKDPELQALMMNMMGGVYENLGLLQKAEDLQRAALENRRAVLGPEHPDTLSTMRGLATTLIYRGRSQEAEKVAAEALAAQRRTLGLEHPDTLQSANTLGWALQEEGRFPEAEAILRETMAAQVRVLGPEDVASQATVADLAATLQQEHKYAEAEKLLTENLAIQRRVLGPEHFSTMASMSRLATTLIFEGRYTEAEVLLREILALRLRILGREHMSTLASMNNLGTVLLREGRYAESEQTLREALELQIHFRGPDHPNTALTRYNLACAAALQGERDKALTWLGDALDHGLNAGGAAQIGEDPDLQFLHGDARFEALVAKGKERAANVTGRKGERSPALPALARASPKGAPVVRPLTVSRPIALAPLGRTGPADGRRASKRPEHDRAVRIAPSDFLEACASEDRGKARVRLRILPRGIRLHCRRAFLPGEIDGRGEQRGADSLPPVTAPDEEAGDRPDRARIERPATCVPVQVRQSPAWRHLAPAHRRVSVEGQQPRRRPTEDDLTKVGAIPFSGSVPVRGADAPVHAPAAIAGAVGAEEVLQRGPEIRSQWADRELPPLQR